MRKPVFFVILLVASLSFAAHVQQLQWNPQQKAAFFRIHQTLTPQLRADLARAVGRFAPCFGPADSRSDPEAMARRVAAGLAVPGMDLDTLTFYVLGATYRCAEEDLKSLVDELQKMNRAKQALRDRVRKLRRMMRNSEPAGQGQPRPRVFLPVPGAAFHAAIVDPCRPAWTRNLRIRYCLAPQIPPLPDMKNWTAAQLRSRLELCRSQLKAVGDRIEQNEIILSDAMGTQARLIHMMSNFLKASHDTRGAAIRNVK